MLFINGPLSLHIFCMQYVLVLFKWIHKRRILKRRAGKTIWNIETGTGCDWLYQK